MKELTKEQINNLKEDLISDTPVEILVIKYDLDIKTIEELRKSVKNSGKIEKNQDISNVYNLNIEKIRGEIELLDEKRKAFELKGDWQAWTKITALKEQYIDLLTKRMENIQKLKLQAYQVENKTEDIKKAVFNFIQKFAESWEDDKIIIKNREMVQDLERRKGIISVPVDEKPSKEKKGLRQEETANNN